MSMLDEIHSKIQSLEADCADYRREIQRLKDELAVYETRHPLPHELDVAAELLADDFDFAATQTEDIIGVHEPGATGLRLCNWLKRIARHKEVK